MRTVFRKLGKFFNGNRETPASPEQAIVVSDSVFDTYSFIIGSLFSYFNYLAPEGKKRFIQRVYHFKSSKKFHFIGMEALVLGGDVEMAGSGRRQQLDLFAHGLSSLLLAAGLNLHALRAQLGNDLVDALLFNRTQPVRGNAQGHPTLLGLDPETLRTQVRQKAAALLVVGVRDAVTDGRLLAGDFANAGHTNNLEIQ